MDFFEFKCQHMGIEFRHNGHVIPASIAWTLIRKNDPTIKLTSRDKPGWNRGILESLEKYEEYLLKLKFL